MRFSFLKRRPCSQPDSLFKMLSLYLILAGLVVMVLAALSMGVWGNWSTLLLPRLSTQWLLWGARGIGLGCTGLMLHDIVRFITGRWQKYRQRKGGTR